MITAITFMLQLATPPQPPHQGRSEWHETRGSEGVTRTVVDRSFSFALTDIDGKDTDLLFSQTVTMVSKPAIEGGDANRLEIEVWARTKPDTGYQRLLWRRSFVGGHEGRLLDHYYDVSIEGCCAAWPAHTYVALRTGKPVMTFTSEPLRLYAPGPAHDQRGRVITYENTSSTLWSYGDRYIHTRWVCCRSPPETL